MSVRCGSIIAGGLLLLLAITIRLWTLITLLVHQVDDQILQLPYASLYILRGLLFYRRWDIEAGRLSIALDALVASGIVGAITLQFALSTWYAAELRTRALLFEMRAVGQAAQRLLGLSLRSPVDSTVRFVRHDGCDCEEVRERRRMVLLAWKRQKDWKDSTGLKAATGDAEVVLDQDKPLVRIQGCAMGRNSARGEFCAVAVYLLYLMLCQAAACV